MEIDLAARVPSEERMKGSQVKGCQMKGCQMNDSQYVSGWPAAVVGLQEFSSVASEMWYWNVPAQCAARDSAVSERRVNTTGFKVLS